MKNRWSTNSTIATVVIAAISFVAAGCTPKSPSENNQTASNSAGNGSAAQSTQQLSDQQRAALQAKGQASAAVISQHMAAMQHRNH